MISKIVEGISITLNVEFGEEYETYSNDLKQGFKEPCFFIAVLSSSVKPMASNRYCQSTSFDVHYFPTDPNSNGELLNVGRRLINTLNVINLLNGVKLRGLNRRYEIVDEVLHFFVDFKINYYIKDSVDQMKDVSIITLKG